MEHYSLIQKIILYAIPMIFAITVHETAHGWVASKLGDQTARMMGRLTLNPIKHIDLIGTILIPAVLLIIGGFAFGWAKPVPITWRNLKNPRRDMALVAIAGPAANLLMISIWVGLAKLSTWAVQMGTFLTFANVLYMMSLIGIFLNLVLLVLNSIPLPPLDGSRVVSAFLRGKISYYYNRIEPYGFFILIALLALGGLSPLMSFVLQIQSLIGSFFGLYI